MKQSQQAAFMPQQKTIQDILHSPRLPSLPAVAIRVLELTSDENVNIREVADLIQNDQALSLKVIRTVNSSCFGLSRPCTSINQAIVFLGLDAVKTLVLGFSLVDSIDGSSEFDISFNYTAYWRRALHSAVAAREVGRLTDACDPEEAFLAALIQDLGMVALYRAFGDLYIQVIDLTHGDHDRLVAKEQRSLEMNHAEVGAAIGELWHLPDQLVCAIRYHHQSGQCDGPYVELARIVELAGHIAVNIDEIEANRSSTKRTRSTASDLASLIAQWTGLKNEQIESLLSTVRHGAGELASLLKVNINNPLEIDQVMHEAEDQLIRRTVLDCHAADHAQLKGSVAVGISRGSIAETANVMPSQNGTACVRSSHRGATIVSPPVLRQRLRTEMAAAESRNGCVAVMACELCSPPGTRDEPTTDAATLTEQIAEELGADNVISQSGTARIMLFVPRADRITAARLAHTIRQRLTPPPQSTDAAGDREYRPQLNIGAAAYEAESREIISDEQNLLTLAEQALELAVTAGPGAIRVFNPISSRERAA